MGPVGNYVTLLQLARGRGGYGMQRGPMGYGPYGAPQQQGYGAPQMGGLFGGGMQGIQSLSASPAMQALRDKYAGMGPQGSSWEQPPPQEAMEQGAPGAPPEATPQLPAGLQNFAAGSAMQSLRDKYAGMGPQTSSWEQPPGPGAMQGNPYMNTAYNAMGLRGRRRFY